MREIAIIGGGASGMAAAIRAAESPEHHITLLERQDRVGRKLLATGNGRCNLSNTAAAPAHYHGADPAFTAPALAAFPPARVLDFFASLGLLTREEYGGRVYPRSDYAASVLDVLRFGLEKPNVSLRTGVAVKSVARDGQGFRLDWDGGGLRADKLIVACGGCAGAKLGGVSDGYALLSRLGHSRTALYPALTQLRTAPELPRTLKGVRVTAALSLLRGEHSLARTVDDVLFTDTGLSGTASFALSRFAARESGLTAALDFFPELDAGELMAALRLRRGLWGDKPANQLLTGMVQSRLGQMLCKAAGISGGDRLAELSDDVLAALAGLVKNLRLPVTGVSGFETAQVTAGGMQTAEFDPETMESRLLPGLYACGEVLDIDGDCGGYNLHWAWASGLLAGGAV